MNMMTEERFQQFVNFPQSRREVELRDEIIRLRSAQDRREVVRLQRFLDEVTIQLAHAEGRESKLAEEAERLKAELAEFRAFCDKVTKDSIKALWDDDPCVAFTAGPDGPGLVIQRFQSKLSALETKYRETLLNLATCKPDFCNMCREQGLQNEGLYQCADCNLWYCQPHANEHFKVWPEEMRQLREGYAALEKVAGELADAYKYSCLSIHSEYCCDDHPGKSCEKVALDDQALAHYREWEKKNSGRS